MQEPWQLKHSKNAFCNFSAPNCDRDEISKACIPEGAFFITTHFVATATKMDVFFSAERSKLAEFCMLFWQKICK